MMSEGMGAARLREAAREWLRFDAEVEPPATDAPYAEHLAYETAKCAITEAVAEALAAVPEAPEPPAHDCEAELKARPDYDLFRGTPASFACSCGARFAFCDDEAEGAWWELVEEGTER